MIDYRFTTDAEDDLFEIWCYIGRDSVAAANRVESAVYEACVFLAKEPWSGSTREVHRARDTRERRNCVSRDPAFPSTPGKSLIQTMGENTAFQEAWVTQFLPSC